MHTKSIEQMDVRVARIYRWAFARAQAEATSDRARRARKTPSSNPAIVHVEALAMSALVLCGRAAAKRIPSDYAIAGDAVVDAREYAVAHGVDLCDAKGGGRTWLAFVNALAGFKVASHAGAVMAARNVARLIARDGVK